MDSERTTTTKLKEMKAAGEKIAALTAWDHVSGKLAEAAGADLVLVGDSLAMTIRGDENTLAITLDEMLYHTGMVAKGCRRSLVIGDMPFMSYQVGVEQAVANAGRFLKDAGAGGVKIEGGRRMADTVARLTGVGIPVLGHIGLTPQSFHQTGGYKVSGKAVDEAKALLEDAAALEGAGVFAIVIECVPSPLAKKLTDALSVPTIGIGAGPYCDGQIQVSADVIGLTGGPVPKHAKKYADVHAMMLAALVENVNDVRRGDFPGPDNSFPAPPEVQKAIDQQEI